MTIDKFFEFARERYQIYLRKEAGEPKPWSQDPIFQREYFCNIFREDDKTTKWFRENIREPLDKTLHINPKIILLSIVAFRWFNRIETWDVFANSSAYHTSGSVYWEALFGAWNSKFFKEYLLDHGSSPWVTGAYIIKTPDNMNKLDGVLWCIDQFNQRLHEGEFNQLVEGRLSMQAACELLKTSPYLGNFMAWQICSDARQTQLLRNAPDKDTWAQPGPGSARGLGRVFHNNAEHFNYTSTKDANEMLRLMQELVKASDSEEYWPAYWPKIAVVDCSHILCEYDKYCRSGEGGRMKRKYNAHN